MCAAPAQRSAGAIVAEGPTTMVRAPDASSSRRGSVLFDSAMPVTTAKSASGSTYSQAVSGRSSSARRARSSTLRSAICAIFSMLGKRPTTTTRARRPSRRPNSSSSPGRKKNGSASAQGRLPESAYRRAPASPLRRSGWLYQAFSAATPTEAVSKSQDLAKAATSRRGLPASGLKRCR